jgi:hypothetical protein
MPRPRFGDLGLLRTKREFSKFTHLITRTGAYRASELNSLSIIFIGKNSRC